jgi:L-threonylcarbamoyladenylate synthase
MRRVFINPRDPDPAALADAARVLLSGGVVAYPTDTLYGLAADPRNPDAVQKLYRIKLRRVEQAIPLVAASREQVLGCAGVLPALAETLSLHFWPGPLTLLMPVWPGLASSVTAGLGTVAIRVPDHPIAQGLAAALRYPITSTSANRTGQNAPSSALGVVSGLGTEVDLVVDGGATAGGLPSTIVDATGMTPRLVRPGAVAWERVLEVLRASQAT